MFINPILALLPLISVTQGKSPPFPLFSTKIGGSLPPGAAATGAGGLNKTVSGANGTGNGTGNSSDSGGYESGCVWSGWCRKDSVWSNAWTGWRWMAAISILNPTSNTIWYANDTVTMNWTLSDPTSDTYLFRAFLSNEDQSLLQGNASIADSTNATALFVKILLPRVSDGNGYIVNFVNTSNEQQVFATTPSFMIQQGEMRNMSTTAGPSSTMKTGGIPNSPSSTSAAGFPSASSSAPNAGRVAAVPLGPLAQAGAIVAVAFAGVGFLM